MESIESKFNRLVEIININNVNADYYSLHKEWSLLVEVSKELNDMKTEAKKKLSNEERPYDFYHSAPKKPKDTSRAESMAEMFKQGKTLQEIGDHFCISRERVRQLLKQVGVSGKDGGHALKPKRTDFICKVENCSSNVKTMGYCAKHYGRVQKHGTPTPEFKRQFQEHDGSCMVEGCNRPFKSNGYCNTHLARWRKTGDAGSAEIIPVGKHKNRGKAAGPRKRLLSDTQMEEIRRLYVRGIPGKESEFSTTGLGKKYGVSGGYISMIVNDKIK